MQILVQSSFPSYLPPPFLSSLPPPILSSIPSFSLLPIPLLPLILPFPFSLPFPPLQLLYPTSSFLQSLLPFPHLFPCPTHLSFLFPSPTLPSSVNPPKPDSMKYRVLGGKSTLEIHVYPPPNQELWKGTWGGCRALGVEVGRQWWWWCWSCALLSSLLPLHYSFLFATLLLSHHFCRFSLFSLFLLRFNERGEGSRGEN